MTDTERLDWLMDDLGIDEIGNVDIHEEVSRLMIGTPGMTHSQAYAIAYRAGIDTAMNSECDAAEDEAYQYQCDCAPGCEPGHSGTPPAKVYYPEAKAFLPIDACIANTIKHLWENGIKTRGSCCGHGDVLPSLVLTNNTTDKDAAAIRNIIADVDPREWKLMSWRLVEFH